MSSQIALSTQGLGKRYGPLWALHDVTLRVEAGSVLGLLGENGAGKSTFISLVSGAQPPSEGMVFVREEPVELSDPREAGRLGIVVVHQEPKLANEVSIAENIFLPELGERSALAQFRQRKLVVRAQAHLDELGLADELPHVSTQAHRLSAAERQLVAIARAMVSNVTALFLDEPNSSLTPKETAILWGLVRGLRDRGVAVVVVSHRLTELYQVIDRVAVLRDGKLVGQGRAADIPVAEAINLMAGREIAVREVTRSVEHTPGEEVVRLEKVYTRDIHGIDLTLRAGEILGLAGLVGAGRTEIGHALSGGRRVLSGRLILRGKLRAFRNQGRALKAGIAMTGEERRLVIFPNHDVGFNIAASSFNRLGRFGFISRKRECALAETWIQKLSLKGTPATPITSLSGGNQQKALISRALAAEPQIVVFDEPTHGIDVSTKVEIARLIRSLADDGLAVVLISSEVEELVGIADRVAVIRDGRIVREAAGSDGLSLIAAALGEVSSGPPASIEKGHQ